MATLPLESGGFLQPALPPSLDYSINSPLADSILPQPRSTPLKSGSARERTFIDYVDQKLLGISRRYEKRFNANFNDSWSSVPEGRGYEEFGEAARDLEALTDVIWVSGTRSLEDSSLICLFANCGVPALLQTPYLLTIALAVSSYMSSFPFAPLSTFKVLHKLDMAFSSLLRGVNVQTGVKLPGFESGRGRLSTTEKVRIRGIVERSRVAVVEVSGKDGSMMDSASGLNSGTETDDEYTTVRTTDTEDIERGYDEAGHGRWEMEVARVYERTIVELELFLDSSGIGGFEEL